VYQQEWLDAANSALWIAVVLMFEVEIRFPDGVARYRTAFVSTAAVLYSGLGVLVLMWAWRSEYGDERAWSRTLGDWIVAAGPDALYPVIAGGSRALESAMTVAPSGARDDT